MSLAMGKPSQEIQFYQVDLKGTESKHSQVITEMPVSLTVNGQIWLTFMCTPADLEALAVGFLYNEQVINSYEEVESVRLCDTGDNIDVWLSHSIEKPDNWRRTSGCTGGITSIESEPGTTRSFLESTNGAVLTANQVGKLMRDLFSSQDLYRESGGVHTSAISDGHKICISAEDIGRHNSLDKIAGLCLMENIELHYKILLTTGRISSEMLQKAARIGASIVISRTSPSSLSIKLANQWKITLIGYARRNQFNIYTHPQRIILPESRINYSVPDMDVNLPG